MTVRRGRVRIVGALVGVVSLAGAVWASLMQANATVLWASNPALTVPPPREFVTTGMTLPPLQAPLTPNQRTRLRDALWRDPFDQKLVNLLYVDALRIRGSDAAGMSVARALGRLGWRYTPAQQNLMLQAALDTHFGEVVDRADALLRRQKLTDQAITMLVAMEAIPQVHGLVVDKLLGDPMWRHDYLLRIGPQAPSQILDARIRTMQTLLRSPDGASRTELAPTLRSLVANGRAREAYDLWILKAGRLPADNLVRDPRFRIAGTTTGEEAAIPFEWQLNQNLGYSANASQQGVTITWDGRGVPTFMHQLIAVEPGHGYQLTIEGRSDNGMLQKLLSPALACGSTIIAFTPIADSNGGVRYRSAPIPQGCDMADLLIGGSVDAGTRSTTMDIGRVIVQRAE